MWDFQYSRMRILNINIRGYRMRILYILLYWGYENEFQSQMSDDEENSENHAVIKLMNKRKCN